MVQKRKGKTAGSVMEQQLSPMSKLIKQTKAGQIYSQSEEPEP